MIKLMKFFISGQIDDADSIKTIIASVEKAGHTITHNWTTTDTFLDSEQDKLNDPKEAGLRARNDMEGVLRSDIYVLSSNNQNVGKGMYVELGAALALNEATGKPRVYIIGELNHLSVFYLHPAVVRKKTIEDVLSNIG